MSEEYPEPFRLNAGNLNHLGRALTAMLRHDETVVTSITGWVDLPEIVMALAKKGCPSVTDELLIEIAKRDTKGRLERAVIGNHIMYRARYGHSVPNVFSDVVAKAPCNIPNFKRIYHGTSTVALTKILAEGLLPMGRNHVHMTDDLDIARDVAHRHVRRLGGDVAVISIDARELAADTKCRLWFSEGKSNLYLSRHVPVRTFDWIASTFQVSVDALLREQPQFPKPLWEIK